MLEIGILRVHPGQDRAADQAFGGHRGDRLASNLVQDLGRDADHPVPVAMQPVARADVERPDAKCVVDESLFGQRREPRRKLIALLALTIENMNRFCWPVGTVLCPIIGEPPIIEPPCEWPPCSSGCMAVIQSCIASASSNAPRPL